MDRVYIKQSVFIESKVMVVSTATLLCTFFFTKPFPFWQKPRLCCVCVSAFGRKGGEATAHNLLVKLLANLLSKLHVSTVYVLKLRCENFDDLDSARDRLSIKLTW